MARETVCMHKAQSINILCPLVTYTADINQTLLNSLSSPTSRMPNPAE